MNDDDYGSDWIRNSLIDVRNRLAQRPHYRGRAGSSSVCGKIVDEPNTPKQAGRYFVINPVSKFPAIDTTGAEVDEPEVDENQRIPVFVMGPCVPLPGEFIVAHSVAEGGRWVSQDYCRGRICAVLTQCGQQNLALVAGVTVRDEDGNIVGECMSTAGIVRLTLESAGDGYTDGVGYELEFSGGFGTVGQKPTGTFDVYQGKVRNVVVDFRGMALVSPPTVSIPAEAGPGTGARITATIGSICCVPIQRHGTFSLHAQTNGNVFFADATAESISGEDVLVDMDLPAASTVTLGFSAQCDPGLITIFSVHCEGPGGYSRTQSPNLGTRTVVFSNLAVAGDYTFTFNIINGQPVPPLVVSVELCEDLTIDVPVFGHLFSGAVRVLGCDGVSPVAGALVTIQSTGDTPTYFATGTTDANGQFAYSGAIFNCDYTYSAEPPGDCSGFLPVAFTAMAGSKNMILGLKEGYGCYGNKTCPPTGFVGGPGGAAPLVLTADGKTYMGTFTAQGHVTGCTPPNFDADNAMGDVEITVFFSPGERPSLTFDFKVCAIGGAGNPFGFVAFYGAGTQLSIPSQTGSRTGGLCPMHAVIQITEDDINRVIGNGPAHADLVNILVGTWSATE